MGRISDEERDTLFGRRLVKSFTGNPKETVDFWDQQRMDDLTFLEDREPIDHVFSEQPGTRGYRRRPQYIDERGDWD